mmetsp:Transcript_30424/g.71700  ORF Transcript_30424/g.71700 Transcript_30424/m.71700 type:complete len:210 (-) Transcript_30424:306-935(-)
MPNMWPVPTRDLFQHLQGRRLRGPCQCHGGVTVGSRWGHTVGWLARKVEDEDVLHIRCDELCEGDVLRVDEIGVPIRHVGEGDQAAVRVPARLALRAAVVAEVDGAHALEGVEREEPCDDFVGRRLGRQSEGDPVAQPARGRQLTRGRPANPRRGADVARRRGICVLVDAADPEHDHPPHARVHLQPSDHQQPPRQFGSHHRGDEGHRR